MSPRRKMISSSTNERGEATTTSILSGTTTTRARGVGRARGPLPRRRRGGMDRTRSTPPPTLHLPLLRPATVCLWPAGVEGRSAVSRPQRARRRRSGGSGAAGRNCRAPLSPPAPPRGVARTGTGRATPPYIRPLSPLDKEEARVGGGAEGGGWWMVVRAVPPKRN